MYAIIEVADKQFKVRKGETVYVPLLDQKPDASITIEDVLLVSKDGDIKVGTPTVTGAKVKAKVLEHVKADKVLVFKKKRRKRFKVKRGHRQQYTKLQIDDLSVGAKKKKAAAKPKKAEAPAEPAGTQE